MGTKTTARATEASSPKAAPAPKGSSPLRDAPRATAGGTAKASPFTFGGGAAKDRPSSPLATKATELRPRVAPAPAPPAPAPAPPAPEAPRVIYAVDTPGSGDRELTVEEIGREIDAGTITADTLVWREGMAEWLEVHKVPELAKFLKKPEVAKPIAPKLGTATSPSPTGRFRPRQPTLPMGALPGPVQGQAKAEKAEEARRLPPVEPKVKPKEEAQPKPAPEPKSATAHKPPAPPIPRAPFLTPVPTDDEPTVLRSPEAVAALLNAAEGDDTTPVPPRLAAQLATHRASVPEPRASVPEPPPSPAAPPARSSPRAADRVTPPPPIPFPQTDRQTTPKVNPVDTFRESPEAKRAWFPEPVTGQPPAPRGGTPPPMPAQPAASPTGPGRPPTLPAEAAPPPQAPSPPAASAPSAAQNPLAGLMSPPALPVTSGNSAGSALASSSANTTPATQSSVVLDEALGSAPKRGKGLWIALALLVVAAAAVAAFLMLRPTSAAPLPPAPNPTALAEAAPPPTPPPEPAAAPEPEPAATAQPEAAAPAEPARADPAPATTPETSPTPAADPAPAATPGFADLFAAGAKRAEAERFDAKAAKRALDALLPEAARCRERGGPVGITRITVTFEPSGNVSSAIVHDAPLAGTSTGACISSVFRRATVKPFTGLPGNVVQHISIQ